MWLRDAGVRVLPEPLSLDLVDLLSHAHTLLVLVLDVLCVTEIVGCGTLDGASLFCTLNLLLQNSTATTFIEAPLIATIAQKCWQKQRPSGSLPQVSSWTKTKMANDVAKAYL